MRSAHLLTNKDNQGQGQDEIDWDRVVRAHEELKRALGR